jgi:hypothetical protein
MGTTRAGHDDRCSTVTVPVTHRLIGTPMCPHTPACPPVTAPDAAAARIVSEHLQDCGYALLCNGGVLLEGDGLLAGAGLLDGDRETSAA